MAKNIQNVRNFRQEIFDKIENRESYLWENNSLKDIKKILIIMSPPRSGSSFLFSVMKELNGIYSLSGESTPFYILNEFTSDMNESDHIPASAAEEENPMFSRDIMSDLSIHNPIKEMTEIQMARYIDRLALRFSLQWPDTKFSYKDFNETCQKLLRCQEFSTRSFYLKLIKGLRQYHEEINPYYYDICPDLVRREFPDLSVPIGPPTQNHILEESPFITLEPSNNVTGEDLKNKTFLMKTTLNNYRMDFIEKIFKNADIKIIYLTRNPAATTNGLMDGWNHRGYFSHNLENILRGEKLNIKGYNEKYWWNYDLPRGWFDYKDKSLAEVCLFQWISANNSILEYLSKGKDFLQIRYENLITYGDYEFKKILDFIGLEKRENLRLSDYPIIQATERPGASRWKKRECEIIDTIKKEGINELIRKVGYDIKRMEEWI
jgi:hypothetical protein